MRMRQNISRVLHLSLGLVFACSGETDANKRLMTLESDPKESTASSNNEEPKDLGANHGTPPAQTGVDSDIIPGTTDPLPTANPVLENVTEDAANPETHPEPTPSGIKTFIWEKIYNSVPGTLKLWNIVQADENTLYISGGSDWDTGSSPATIVKSSDRGTTWNLIPLPEFGSGKWLKGLTCLNKDNCWAVGKSGLILHSADGGKTWNSHKTPLYSSYLYGISVKPNGEILATCTSFAPAFVLSKDNGSSFSPINQDNIVTTTRFDLICLDNEICLASGSGNRVYRSNDGGNTWTKPGYTLDYPGPGYWRDSGGYFFYGLDCVDKNNCWVVGGYSAEDHAVHNKDGRKFVREIHHSSNAFNGNALSTTSLDFLEAATEADPGRFSQIDMLTLEYGVTVGDHGLIYLTKDGKTWSRQEKFTEANLQDVLVLGINDIIVIDWDGNIWRSKIP